MRKKKKKNTSIRAQNALSQNNLVNANFQSDQLPIDEDSGSICASSSGNERSWERELANFSSEDDSPNYE